MSEFSFTYRAFISYSHADHDHAVWLHRALERYRVPRRLSGADGLKRLGKMFRDEEELAAAAELGPKIAAALKASDVLIVICSPRSAKSVWVNQEIEAFKQLGREGRVFALIVDGTPHGVDDECFPPALKVTAAGGVAEPLAVDARKFGREDAVLRLVAGMLDVGYDDLRRREVRRRRAEMMRAQALFATGLVLVAAALTGGWFAATNYVDASERTSRLFAREANALSAEGDGAKAMLVALYADPAAQAGVAERILRPDGYPEARAALTHGLSENRVVRSIQAHDGTLEGRVTAVALTAQGDILTSSYDMTAKLWSGRDGKLLATFAGHTGRIENLALSPDGTLVATASSDNTVKLWKISGGAPIASLDAPGRSVYRVRFSPDGKHVLTASRDEAARLWSVQDASVAATYPHPNYVVDAGFSPDGSMVVITDEDGNAQLWPLAGGAPAKTVKASVGGFSSATFSPDGTRVFLTNSGAIMGWRLEDNSLYEVAVLGSQPISAIAVSPDGKTLLAGTNGGLVALIDAENDRIRARYIMHRGWITGAAFSSDGKQVLTGGEDGVAKLWSVQADKPEGYALDRGASSLAFSPDSSRILVGQSFGGAGIFPAAGGERLVDYSTYNFEIPEDEDKTDSVSAVAFSPDGSRVLTGSRTGEVVLWPSAGGEAIARFKLHDSWISALAFFPDGRIMTASSDGEIRIWPATGGEALASLWIKGEIMLDAALSPDGTRIVAGYGTTARIWDVESRKVVEIKTGYRYAVAAAAFSADGKQVVTGGDGGDAKVWSSADGAPLGAFSGDGPSVEALAFSPDGRLLATTYEGGVRIWSSESRALLKTIRSANLGSVTEVVFLPDGKSVATLADRGAVNVWRLPAHVFMGAAEQVRVACLQLRDIGATALSEADYIRFPILDRNAPHPCEKVWADGKK